MGRAIAALQTISDRQKEVVEAGLSAPGGAVVVQGWAGTGKSTVLDAIADEVLNAGGVVISVPQGFDFAVCREASGEGRTSATIANVDGRTGRIAQFVLEQSASRPILLVADDVNELTDEQCRHLRSLIRGIGPEVTVAVSIRTQLGCSGEAGRLVDDLQQVMRALVVNLEPWTTETVTTWIEDELDTTIGMPSAATIVGWTSGLAGWTTFAVRSMLDNGLLRSAGGRLELVADLRRVAGLIGPAVRRYLDPASELRWAVAELLLRTGPIPMARIGGLGCAVSGDEGDSGTLVDAAGRLLDEAIIKPGRGQVLSFTNALIEEVVRIDVDPDPAVDHRLAELLVIDDLHRTDRHLARALCRVACSAPVPVESGELLAAAEQIAPYDPKLATVTADLVVGRGGPAATEARRLLAQLASIDEESPDGSPVRPATRSTRSVVLAGATADGARAATALESAERARPDRCREVVDAIVAAHMRRRPEASALEAVRLDLDLTARLLSTGRAADAGHLLDSLDAQAPAGSLGATLGRLRLLHTVMTGRTANDLRDLIPPDADPGTGSDLDDPVLYCAAMLLRQREDPSNRWPLTGSGPLPIPSQPGLWGAMIAWLATAEAGRPGLLVPPIGDAAGGTLVDQFARFVEQAFVDGAILVVDELDGVPSPETRDAFRRQLLDSWAADLPLRQTGAAELFLDPFDERIARRVADGLTNAEVAAELDIALHTVSNRLKVIYRRLGVRNRTALRGAMESQHR